VVFIKTQIYLPEFTQDTFNPDFQE